MYLRRTKRNQGKTSWKQHDEAQDEETTKKMERNPFYCFRPFVFFYVFALCFR